MGGISWIVKVKGLVNPSLQTLDLKTKVCKMSWISQKSK